MTHIREDMRDEMAEQIKLYNKGYELARAAEMTDDELSRHAHSIREYLNQDFVPERQKQEASTYLGRIAFEIASRMTDQDLRNIFDEEAQVA